MENKKAADSDIYGVCDADFIKNTDMETAVRCYNAALADKADDSNQPTEHAKEVIQAFFKKVSEIPEIFMMYNEKTTSSLPTLDLNGNAWFFTNEEYANAVLKKNDGTDIRYKKIDNKAFNMLIRYEFRRFGIRRIIINPACGDKTAVVSFSFSGDEFCSEGFGEGTVCDNSVLSSAILRYMQILGNAGTDSTTDEHIKNLKTMLYDLIKNSVFLLPVTAKEGEDLQEIRYTAKTENAIKRSGSQYRFFSVQKNKWAKEHISETVSFSTVRNAEGQTFLPMFTDMIEFGKAIKGKNIACAVMFAESAEFLSEQCGGAVINCAGLALALTRDMITEIMSQKQGSEEEKRFGGKRLYVMMCGDNPILEEDETIKVFTDKKKAVLAVNSEKIRALCIDPKDYDAVFSRFYELCGISKFRLDDDEKILNILDCFKCSGKTADKKDIGSVKNPQLKKALIVHEQFIAFKGASDGAAHVKAALLYNILSELDNSKLLIPLVKKEDKTGILIMNDNKGNMFVPVFTDAAELMKIQGQAKFSMIGVYTAETVAESIDAGLIVNPGSSEKAVIDKERIKRFYETKHEESIGKDEQEIETDKTEKMNSEEEKTEGGSVFGKFKDAYKRFTKK